MIDLVDEVRPDDPIGRLATIGIGYPAWGPPGPDEGAVTRIAIANGQPVGIACLWPGPPGAMSALTLPEAREALTVLLGWLEHEAAGSGAVQLSVGIPDFAKECIELAAAHGFERARSNLTMRRAALSAPPVVMPPGVRLESPSPELLTPVASARDEMWERVPGLRMPTSPEWVERMMSRSRAGRVRVALCDGDPIGYAWSTAERDVVTLEEVAIAPEFRRRGIARALVGDVLEWAQQRAAAQVELVVTAENPTGAPELYRLLGFVVERSSGVYVRSLAS